MYIFAYIDIMKQTLYVTEVKRNFPKLVDKVEKNCNRVYITKDRKVKAILLSSNYLNLLEKCVYNFCVK